MVRTFIAENMRHLHTAVRLLLALMLMLLVGCCLSLPPHASLADLLREYAASSGGIFPGGVLSWKTPGFAVLLALVFVPRGLGALWNVVLCVSLALSLGWISCMVFGPHLLLPAPLDSCREAVAFMQMPDTGGAVVSVALCACILGGLCACTRMRVAVTTLVSMALWFLLSDMIWWALAGDPAPDALLYETARSVKFHPWVCALLPGLFFGVFMVLMSLLHAYADNKGQQVEDPSALPQPKPEETEKDIVPAEIVEPAKPAPTLPEPTVVEAEVVDNTPATPPAP